MIGYGVKPLGLNPLTSASLYNKIVVPTTLYGCELWNGMTQSDAKLLNRHQHYIVKKIQGFPQRTRSDICESMLGLKRITAEIDKKKLMFLYKIMSLPGPAISRNIFFRKLYMFMVDSVTVNSGFVPDICKLLTKYRLEYILQSYNHLPPKCAWKRDVDVAVTAYEHSLWRQRLDSDADFSRFRRLHTAILPSIVWCFPRDNTDLRTADLIAQLWTRVPDRHESVCRVCNGLTEDMIRHCISECQLTLPLRDAFMDDLYRRFSTELYNELDRTSAESFTEITLGGPLITVFDMEHDMQYDFLRLTFSFVRMCYNEYIHRA